MTHHRPDCGCSQHREPEPVVAKDILGRRELDGTWLTLQAEAAESSVTLGREYQPTVPRQMGWDVRGLVDALWRERASQWMTDPETGIRVSFLRTVKSD